ncbi:MAG: hypothetical protein AB1486_09965 [Planctomycetota bacterium]
MRGKTEILVAAFEPDLRGQAIVGLCCEKLDAVCRFVNQADELDDMVRRGQVNAVYLLVADGLEAEVARVERLRRVAGLRRVPILVAVPEPTEYKVLAMLRAGATDVLGLPTGNDDYAKRLKRLVQAAREDGSPLDA